VTLEVRLGAPTTATGGVGARHVAEIIVRDTGPGIPAAERTRVFERGARLARDRNVPGSGIGLAVVREMVSAHGGTVHADEASGGGAEFVVRLPIDMRTRRDSSVVLIDDGDAARRIVAALRERRESSLLPLRAEGTALEAALETCKAIVVVPRDNRLGFEALLDAAPPAMSGEAPRGTGGPVR
jgi:hypothetical protein